MIKTSKRIAFVNFTGLRANWGCQATSWECLKWLQPCLPIDWEPEICLVPLLPRCDWDLRLEAEKQAIGSSMMTVLAKSKGWRQAQQYLESICIARYGRHALNVKNSDLVVFQGEGTMAGTDIVRGLRLLLLPFVAQNVWSIKVFSINQTLFSGNEGFSDLLAACCNSFSLVAVRENISLDFAAKIDISSVALFPDAAFLTRPLPHPALPDLSSKNFFALSGSAYHLPGRYEWLLECARKVREQTGLKILLVASGIEQEMIDTARSHLQSDDYVVLPASVPYTAVAYALAYCKFLISGRFHMNVLAAAVGVPFIQLRGNSWKNEGLDALLGGITPVYGWERQDDAVAAAISIHQNHRAAVETFRQALIPVVDRLHRASTWLTRRIAEDDVPLPDTLRTVVGQEIDADRSVEPYRSIMTRQALEQFVYPVARDEDGALGPEPTLEQVEVFIRKTGPASRACLSMLEKFYHRWPSHRAHEHNEDFACLEVEYWAAPLNQLRDEVVAGAEPCMSHGRHDDIKSHLEMLQKEFSGKSKLLYAQAALTVLIRRRMSLSAAHSRWQQIWQGETKFLCAHLDSRWLVSACDTLLDHGNPVQRALASTAMVLINTCKAYETERLILTQQYGTNAKEGILLSGRHELFDGVTAFNVGNGDMIFNMIKRLKCLINDLRSDKDSGFVVDIIDALLARACLHDTVFRRFGRIHQQESTRWLPGALSFCGDSHLRAPRFAYQTGRFAAQACEFSLVGGATAVGLRHPTSQTQALAKWEHLLLPHRPQLIPVFQLGEVDCGFVIWLRAQRYGESIEMQLEQSLEAYFSFLSRLKDGGYRNIIVTSAMLPTIRDGQLDSEVAHLRREVGVTQKERTQLTLRYNERLADFCRSEALTFVDFTPDLLDAGTGLIAEHWLHPDRADHHLHPERGGALWVDKIMNQASHIVF